jgi:hypothetical protein
LKENTDKANVKAIENSSKVHTFTVKPEKENNRYDG